MTANIPEIDIAPLIDGSHAAKQSVVGEIEAACADTGFFTIVGHGVDADLLDRIAGDDSFGLRADELQEMVDPMRFVGRAPSQVERFIERIVNPVLEKHRSNTLNLDDPKLHV